MNHSFKVFDLAQADEWRACWQRLPVHQRSVFLLPEYYAIYENSNQGKALCCCYESSGGLLLYPLLKKDLNFLQLATAEQYFDVEGAYGLNGAGYSGLQPADVEYLSAAWAEYCEREHIIAEFTRMNPLLNANEVLSYLHYSLANQAVVVDLGVQDLLYDSYEHSVRKAIKKAERSCVVIEHYDSMDVPADYLKAFSHVYETTMDRKSASDFYYFGEGYFAAIKNGLHKNSRWFFALIDSRIVSVELVLFDEHACYSFLGGTLKDSLSSGANVLLKHHIITHFKSQSLAYYFLGGGTQLDDGIYTYKKTFSKKAPEKFYIGKKIHSAEMYHQAVQRWQFLHPDKCETYKNYFLKYRC